MSDRMVAKSLHWPERVFEEVKRRSRLKNGIQGPECFPPRRSAWAAELDPGGPRGGFDASSITGRDLRFAAAVTLYKDTNEMVPSLRPLKPLPFSVHGWLKPEPPPTDSLPP
jgi:hypothetical protein